MDLFRNGFNLKRGVRDVEFCDALHTDLGALRDRGEIVGYRLTRRKLALGPAELGGRGEGQPPGRFAGSRRATELALHRARRLLDERDQLARRPTARDRYQARDAEILVAAHAVAIERHARRDADLEGR